MRWVLVFLGALGCQPGKPSVVTQPERAEASAPKEPTLAELMTELSEPSGDFASDNLVSNESSYLQVARALESREAGGAYIGVGPEQNLTYIGLTRPRVAFIVDLRRAKRGQLELHFDMRGGNAYLYPTLGALLAQRSPEGRALGFLADEAVFRAVQALQREDRVIPVVGNFAGERALAGVGAELRRRDLRVATFYVSNVEQYLLKEPAWSAWKRNVESLPARTLSSSARTSIKAPHTPSSSPAIARSRCSRRSGCPRAPRATRRSSWT